MFNKKIFCNPRFRWIAIAIGITAACASGSHHAEAATQVIGGSYEYCNH